MSEAPESLDALLAACTPWQQEVVHRMLEGGNFSVSLTAGRAAQSGKRYATWMATRMAVARGEVFHLLRPDGTFCTGTHEDCSLPRWDGEM